ncbi:hypothetical protein ACXZ1K_15030 [Pedobacter sp. PWIIR3]
MESNGQNESKAHKETGYTPGESKFADGKDTNLNTETKVPNGANNQEEENKSGTSEGDADYENPNDDPA